MRWRSGLLAGVVVGAGFMALPAVASAATISESFSPGAIALSGATTLTFTIDNSQDPLPHQVNFDDTLPSGVQIVSGSQGSTCTVPGASSSGPQDLGFSGTVAGMSICTVSATVTGVQAGAWDNPVSITVDTNPPSTVDASVDVIAPPSISAAFGTIRLGLDGTTPLTVTITNPNPSFALSGVGFTDALPAGLVVVGQPAADNCGGTLTAGAGTDSLGLSGGQLTPGATCSVSATIAATATGAVSDTTTQVVSNEGGMGNSAQAGLTVIGAPRVTLTSPVPGHAYAFGQQVRAAFSCADDPNGPGIKSCVGTVASGSLISTAKPGAHSFTVRATSQDGGVASDTVFYSVAPDNRFKVAKTHASTDGSFDFVLQVPGPGQVTGLETVLGRRGLVFARASATARRAGQVSLTLRPTARGRQALAQRPGLRLAVTLGYTPKGGTLRTARRELRVG